jgi:hypothetical protein
MDDLFMHVTNATALASWNDHFSYPVFRMVPFFYHYGGEYFLGALRNFFPFLGPFDVLRGFAITIPVCVFWTASAFGKYLFKKTNSTLAAVLGLLPLLTSGIRFIPAFTHHYHAGLSGVFHTFIPELSAAAMMPYAQVGARPSFAVAPLFIFPLVVQLHRLCEGSVQLCSRLWLWQTAILMTGLSIFDESYFFLFSFCILAAWGFCAPVRSVRRPVGFSLAAAFILAFMMGGSVQGMVLQIAHQLSGEPKQAVAQLSSMTFSSHPTFCAWPKPASLSDRRTWKLMAVEFGFIPLFFLLAVWMLAKLAKKLGARMFFWGAFTILFGAMLCVSILFSSNRSFLEWTPNLHDRSVSRRTLASLFNRAVEVMGVLCVTSSASLLRHGIYCRSCPADNPQTLLYSSTALGDDGTD